MSEQRYRVAAIDLDGTLLSSAGHLSNRAVEVLTRARASGIEPIIVTSRDLDDVLTIADITDVFRIAICCGGSAVYDPHDRTLLAANWFAVDDVTEALRAIAAAVPTAVFGYVSPAGVSHCPDFPPIPGVTRGVALPRERIMHPVDKVFKAFAMDPMTEYGDDRFAAIIREAVGPHAAVGHFTRRFVELLPPRCGKMQTLRGYCTERGISREEVIAFGDSVGDLPMIHWAGRGVAVQNADLLVRQAADEVTASCDNDGVATTLERYIKP